MRLIDLVRGCKTVEDHTFLGSALSCGSVVLDIGANFGTFSTKLAQEFDCRCFAFEPDPNSFELIPHGDRLTKWPVAVSGQSGPRAFARSSNHQASRLTNESDAAMTIESVMLEDFARE